MVVLCAIAMPDELCLLSVISVIPVCECSRLGTFV